MTLFRNKQEHLLRLLDTLIAFNADNPEIRGELEQQRSELQAAAKRGWADFAAAALRLATWIKFALDHLPPPH